MNTDQKHPALKPRAWTWGLLVSILMASYYVAFYLPPRLVGSNDPDRYFHLGLSKLVSNHGWLKTLPQVEDLGWGQYFPDKEFLFHALTGMAHWIGGPLGVLVVVPLLGIAIAICLYVILSRVMLPQRAAILVLAATLLSPVFIFRITLLRPHLLAILFFCLLLAGILRGRAWLIGIATAGFALSYHAFYILVMVIAIAGVFKWPDGDRTSHRWMAALIGLIVGIVLNPYFPSNLVMSWTTLMLALGIGSPAGMQGGTELQPISLLEFANFFAFLPIVLVGAAALIFARRLHPRVGDPGLWFLFVLSAALTVLSLKSSRATEYAVPCTILLAGYCISYTQGSKWLWAVCAALLAAQGHSSYTYYKDIWTSPQSGYSGWYLAAAARLPSDADGKKVFTCEWQAGSYLLFARPEVRFIDLLDPVLLWRAAPHKYLAREALTDGRSSDPHAMLKGVFKADYILCGAAPLNAQLVADPIHFELIPGDEPTGPLKVFRIR